MATDRAYRLSEVLRHDGAILKLATETRQLERGRALFRDMEGGGSRVITYPTLTAWKAAAIALACSPEAQDDPDYSRILAWTNANVRSLNKVIRDRSFGVNAQAFMPGERLISHDSIPDPDGGSPILHSTTEMVVRQATLDAMPVMGDELQEVAIASHGIRRFKKGEQQAAPWTYWQIVAMVPAMGLVEFSVLDQAEKARWDKCQNAVAKLAREEVRGQRRSLLWKIYYARKDSFGQVEPAACLTIHKSQGSTYRHVFLHPDVDGYSANPAPIHNRLAYVGITRASETLHVVADQEGQS